MAGLRQQDRERINSYLASHDDASIVRTMVEDVPYVFGSEGDYANWRGQVVADTSIDPDAIYLVGSGSVGLSLNKFKAGRRFRRPGDEQGPSDLDIAVVDEDSFVLGWEETVGADRERRLGGTDEARQFTRNGIYWGHLSGTKLPNGSGAARRVRLLITAAGRYRPLTGHPPRIRIYRRVEDLRGYQLNSLRGLRRQLEAEEIDRAS